MIASYLICGRLDRGRGGRLDTVGVGRAVCCATSRPSHGVHETGLTPAKVVVAMSSLGRGTVSVAVEAVASRGDGGTRPNSKVEAGVRFASEVN